MIFGFLRNLLGRRHPTESMPSPQMPTSYWDLPHPDVVRRLLPRSAFRKSGPGVLANIRTALLRMTIQQRLVARRKGWDRGMVNTEGSVR